MSGFSADLPAGPELDRAIAEKVMGWNRPGPHDLQNWRTDERGRAHCIAPNHWAPSTRIVDAWAVVERMRDGLVIFRARDDWHAGVMVNGDGFAEHWIDDSLQQHAIADTAPLAICRAALQAVGA